MAKKKKKLADPLLPGGEVAERLKALLAKKRKGKLTEAEELELEAVNAIVTTQNRFDLASSVSGKTPDEIEAVVRKLLGGE